MVRPTALTFTSIALALVLTASSSTPAFGQGAVLALRSHTAANGDIELYELPLDSTGLAAPRALGRWPGLDSGFLTVTADGRFALWSVGPLARQGQFVFDRAIGQGQMVPGVPGGGAIVDPSRSRVFLPGYGDQRIVVAEPGAVRDGLVLGPGWVIDQVSSDGTALFTHRCMDVTVPFLGRECRFAKRDSMTGAIISEAPLPSSTQSIHILPSGEELLVFVGTGDPLQWHVRRLNALTGAQTGSIAAPNGLGGAGALVVHDDGQGFTAGLSSIQPPYVGALWTVDTSLPTWRQVALVPTASHPQLDAAPGAPWLVATSHPFRNGTWNFCEAGTLDLVSPLTGAIVQTLGLPAGGCVRTALAWVRPPGALNASVTGNVVSLAWAGSASPGTHVVVEAGSAAGLSNLARLFVPAGQTSVTVSAVPTGTYFVRIRAVNPSGTSEPSNEVVVSVPAAS